jgi:protein TonB
MGEAFYPSESKKKHEQGKCTMEITVASTGEILRVEITQSTGFARLDAACIEAMKTARFFPATEGGKPVAGIAKFTINWVL